MTPEENLDQSRLRLVQWDEEHGEWNPDTHAYEGPTPPVPDEEETP